MFRSKAFARTFAFLCTIVGAAAAPASAATNHADADQTSNAAPPGIDASSYGIQRVEPAEFNGDVRDLPLYVRPQAMHHWNEFEEPESEKPFVAPAPSQPNVGLAPMPAPIQNFDGLSFTQTVTGGQAGAGFPPDVNGDVGPNHYIQSINDAWAIYSKTGTLLVAFTENALWLGAGTGTPCDSSNFGDPVVLHDGLADRWILTNFAFNTSGGNPVAPFYQCFAVSKTSDPVAGGWWLYAVRMDTGGAGQPPVGYLNDYPKFGVWTDCLYMASNEFQMPAGTYRGVSFASFSRADLFAGNPLTSSNSALGFLAGSNVFTMLPSNLLGTDAGSLPPPGSPNYFVSESQTAFSFDVRKFTPGAGCGAGGTLGSAVSVGQASYSVPGQNIVPQPATGNTLDSLGDRLMQKAQYRKLGSAESLWVVHTTRSGSSGTTRPQWAQINVTGGNVSTTAVQQQIYAPDTTLYRWMGALAVDRLGNMALGYATSNGSSPNFPSIAYSGRLVNDPLNNLSQTETVLVQGLGSQVNTCGGTACHRWGDYSSMSIDPSDDCTFWYTNEYYDSQASGNSGNWHTRIGSFKFPSCTGTVTHTVTPSVGAPSGTISPSTPQVVDDGDTASFTLTPSSGFEISSVGGTCGGSLAGDVFTTNAVTGDCTVIANFAAVVVHHTVTPSVGTPSGTISPSTPQVVVEGATPSFTLSPSSGFRIVGVGGTCGGTLAANVFTTDPVTADCTVIANFTADPHAAITPATLDFDVAFGGSASDVLHIANGGGAALTWSATEASTSCSNPSDVPWISEAPTSGTVAGGDSQDSTIDVDATGLAAGSHSARLCIATNDPTQPLVEVPVTLDVAAAPVAPTVAKAFVPGSVVVNTDSTLTLTLANTNASAATLTMALTDTFPAGLVVSTPAGASTTCAGGTVDAVPGQGAVSLSSGAAIPANGTCTVSVKVRAAAAGSYVNTIPAGALVTDKGANASPASATLTVTAAPVAPTLAKAFSPGSVAVGADSTLSLTLGNTNASAATLTSALTDAFPSGLVVSTPPNASTTCTGGTVDAVAGQGAFSLSIGAQIPANATCTVKVNVRSSSAGSYVNTIPAGALATDKGANASPASATLTVTETPVPPTLSKAFAPDNVQIGSASRVTLTLGNANTGVATLVASLVDTLPSGLVVATPANASTTCPSGTVDAMSGAASITLNASAQIPANGSCTVTVDVASQSEGTYVNTIAAGALQTTLGENAAAATATLVVTPIAVSDRIFCDGFEGIACADGKTGKAHAAGSSAKRSTNPVSAGDRRRH